VLENTIPSQLNSFLRAGRRSKAREFLVTSRVIHDLMTAAAAHDYDLLVYTPTVDSDGFDLIIDDRDRLLPLQVKSVVAGGKTAQWAIHRKLLRPQPHECEDLGFEPSPTGTGRGGGVLLAVIHSSDAEISIEYRYTSIRLLTAIWLGIVKLPSPSRLRLERLRKELREEPSGKVMVPRSAFVRARSTEHLLALAGLHSRVHHNWEHLMHMIAGNEFCGEELPAPREQICNDINRQLSGLTRTPQ